MPEYTQQAGINAARATIDDQYTSKNVFQFSPLKGLQDGTNKIFQIPQSRIVNNVNQAPLPIIYKNKVALVNPDDWSFLDPVASSIQFVNSPALEDDLATSFYWTWFTDAEWDQFLIKAANGIGFSSYFTTLLGTIPTPLSGTVFLSVSESYPSDWPNGLWSPGNLMAGGYAAQALATRYAVRYDTSAGDQSFSPSQMTTAFTKLAEDLFKRADAQILEYYKGQGREGQAFASKKTYCLPPWTPRS